MKKKDIYALVILSILTITTALFSTAYNTMKYASFIILGLSFIKFLLVGFQFMEMKKAHVFWKVFLVSYLSIFGIALLIVLG